MHGTCECAVAADQIKDGKSVFVANDGLAVDQTRANRELANRHCDKGEASRKIVSGAGNQPHARTIPPRQNAEAVMFYFVQPTGAGRRSLGGRRQTRFDDPQSGGGYAHATTWARLIKTETA